MTNTGHTPMFTRRGISRLEDHMTSYELLAPSAVRRSGPMPRSGRAERLTSPRSHRPRAPTRVHAVSGRTFVSLSAGPPDLHAVDLIGRRQAVDSVEPFGAKVWQRPSHRPPLPAHHARRHHATRPRRIGRQALLER